MNDVTEETLKIVIQKLGAKYAAIVTMISELQDNLNQLIQVSFALLKEKDAKILELQVPIKAHEASKDAKAKA